MSNLSPAERRQHERCHNLDALFDRVRRIELILAFIAGSMGVDVVTKLWSKFL